MISYFTFGQNHVHRHQGKTLDCDIVIVIRDENPRAIMEETFGMKWSMEYDKKPDMEYFPRGIYDLKSGTMMQHGSKP